MSNYLNTIAGAVEFGLFSAESSVYLAVSKDDLQWIDDIDLMLHGRPSTAHGTGIDDLHIYINGVDVSAQILSGLRKLLDESDQVEIKKSYRSAIKERIDRDRELLNQFKNVIFFGALSRDLKREEQLGEQISNRSKLSDSLLKLGDRTLGHQGSVDIFNYLYDSIQLPPLSLRELIQSAPVGPAAWKDDWKNALPATMTMSCGPSSRFGAPVLSHKGAPAGGIVYAMNFKYGYSEEFSSFADQLSTTGDIQKELYQISDIVKKISDDLDRSNSQITNALRGLNESCREFSS
jgi:hypothetical protein